MAIPSNIPSRFEAKNATHNVSESKFPSQISSETKGSSLGQTAVSLLKAGVGSAITFTGGLAIGAGGLIFAGIGAINVLTLPFRLSEQADELKALALHLEETSHNISVGEPLTKFDSGDAGKGPGAMLFLTATGVFLGGALVVAGAGLARLGDRIAR